VIKTSAILYENKRRILYSLKATGKALECQGEIVSKTCSLPFENMNVSIRNIVMEFRKKKLPPPAEKITHKNMHVSTRKCATRLHRR
jgi:hypothetical protein